MPKMVRIISWRIEEKGIQDVDVVSPGRNLLDSSETKVIPKSQCDLLREGR